MGFNYEGRDWHKDSPDDMYLKIDINDTGYCTINFNSELSPGSRYNYSLGFFCTDNPNLNQNNLKNMECIAAYTPNLLNGNNTEIGIKNYQLPDSFRNKTVYIWYGCWNTHGGVSSALDNNMPLQDGEGPYKIGEGYINYLQPPIIGNLRNNNKYNNQDGVSAANHAIDIKFDHTGGGNFTKTFYQLDGGAWTYISNYDTYSFTGLDPRSIHTINIKTSNDAGESNILSITVRVRSDEPTLSVSLNQKTLESLKFNWYSNYSIDKVKYNIDNGNWTEMSVNNNTSGTITINNLDPNTSHTISVNVRESLDGLWHSSDSRAKTCSGTTYDIAKISTVTPSAIYHSNDITIQFNNPSGNNTSAKAIITGNNKTVTIAEQNIDNGKTTFKFSIPESKWDSIYKTYGNSNRTDIEIILYTHGKTKKYENTKGKKITLTGIQKTGHFGNSSNKPKRVQFYVGNSSNKPKRAVCWVGVGNSPKRTI